MPLSFTPLPELHELGPRYAALGLTEAFTFDSTGYTLVHTGDRADSASSEAARSVRLQFKGTSYTTLTPGKAGEGVVNDLRGSNPALPEPDP